MVIMNKTTYKIIFFSSLLLILPFVSGVLKDFNSQSSVIEQADFIPDLKLELSSSFKGDTDWPENFKWDGHDYKILYSFNPRLTDYVKKLLRRYKSDYSAVVVLDNETGEILTAIGHDRKSDSFSRGLPFSGSHPSASLFKIVTTAELLRSTDVSKESEFYFRGRGTTLYKNQLGDRDTKWRRKISLERAFANSNNVIFAKAAIGNIKGTEIFKAATDFGFNKSLMEEIDLSVSRFHMPEDQYNLAELASGFNHTTTMSPVHGALLSSIVANHGVLIKPKVVSYLLDTKSGQYLVRKEPVNPRIFDKQVGMDLQEMMMETVKVGTGRRVLRTMRKGIKNNLIIGGKTGSISGGLPFGKRDWFTSFAVPKNREYGRGISICVMNVNVKKWHVKATYLAKEIIEYYYSDIWPINKKVARQISGL